MNRVLSGCVTLALFLAAPLRAQERPIELGVEGIYQVQLREGDDNLTQLFVPSGSLRMGFYLNPRVALEPLLRIERQSTGNGSITGLIVQPSLVLYFREYDRIPQPYVRAGVGISHARISGNSDDTQTDFSAVGAAGVKVPVLENAFLRFEGYINRYFDDENVLAQTALGLAVGISAVIN